MRNPFKKQKTAAETIADMSFGRLNDLKQELDFAILFHTVGDIEAKRCVTTEGRKAVDGAQAGMMFHKNIAENIAASDLYQRLIREFERHGVTATPSNPPDGLDQTDELILWSALSTLYLRWYPRVDGGVIPDDEIAKALEVIHGYGFGGVFVDWETPHRCVELEPAFIKAKL